MNQLTEKQIEDFNERLERLGPDAITTFVEISLSDKQLEVIAPKLSGDTGDDLKKYYKGKIHGELLLKYSSEDQPDFQYLIDLGIKAMKEGMML